jgi:hypothetical protein
MNRYRKQDKGGELFCKRPKFILQRLVQRLPRAIRVPAREHIEMRIL